MKTDAKVLIGAPVTIYKDYCAADFSQGLKNLTHKNIEVMLVDNSPSPLMKVTLEDAGWKVQSQPYSVPTKLPDDIQKQVDGKNIFEIIDHGTNAKLYEVRNGKWCKIVPIRQKLVDARNAMRKKVLDEKFDYFFSIEADVIPPADVIERLIADDKDVVCGIYCNYNRKPSTVQDASGKSFQADIPEFVPMVWDFPKTGDRSIGLVAQNGIDESFPSRLREVSTCGLGCTLIKREVLEKVSFRYEAEYFGCDDQYFGTDARKAGFTIWADSYVWCRHLHSAWNQRIMGVR